MSNRQSFLDEIIANPHDDVARLIYADWLEEQRDPRSEFIRIQIAMEEHEKWSPTWCDLQLASAHLLRLHYEEWQEGLPEWAVETSHGRPDHWGYGRGFLLSAGASIETWLEDQHHFQSEPLHRVTIGNIVDGGRELSNVTVIRNRPSVRLSFCNMKPDASHIWELEHLRDVSELELCFGTTDTRSPYKQASSLTDQDLIALAESDNIECLKGLDLSFHDIGPKGIRSLSRSGKCAELRKLSLHNSRINPDVLREIARSPWMDSLEELNIIGEIPRPGLSNLMGGRPKRLRKLNISCFDEFACLADCPSLSTLRELDCFRPVPDEALNLIANSKVFAKLTALKVGGGNLGDEGAFILAKSSLLRNLRLLDVQRNGIGTAGISALSTSPILDGVTKLMLYENNFGSDGVKAIAASKRLSELRSIDFVCVGNDINGIGAIANSEAFPKLQCLDVQSTPFGDQGMELLLASPIISPLDSLFLYYCALSNGMKKRLSKIPGLIFEE